MTVVYISGKAMHDGRVHNLPGYVHDHCVYKGEGYIFLTHAGTGTSLAYKKRLSSSTFKFISFLHRMEP